MDATALKQLQIGNGLGSFCRKIETLLSRSYSGLGASKRTCTPKPQTVVMVPARDRALPLGFSGFLAMAATMGIGRFVYTPILPFMTQALGLSESQAGLIASANFLGYLLGALGAASAHLSGGRRRWLLAGLAASALSTGAMGLATSIAAFLALRFIGGVASAFVMVFASALVLDRLAPGRSGLAALHFAGTGAGIAFSALLIVGLAAAGLGWRAQWLASGVASLAALLAAWRMVPDAPEAPLVVAEAGRSDMRLTALVLAFGLFGFGYVITATFISTIAHGTPAESLVWIAVGLAAVPSVAFWAAIGQRIGNEAAFALACLTEAAGVALSVLALGAAGILASAVLLGGTMMGLVTLGFIEARRLTRGDPRRSLALMSAAFALGQIIGPSFAGLVYDIAGSFRLPSLVAAVTLVVAAGIVRLTASSETLRCFFQSGFMTCGRSRRS